MQLHGSCSDGAFSSDSHPTTNLSGSNPVGNNHSTTLHAAPENEEKNFDSDVSDIGIARSPHSLALPERNFDHDEDDANASSCSSQLLPVLDSHSDVANTGKDGARTKEKHIVFSQNKPSSMFHRLPWAVLLALLGNLSCIALSVYVLVVSDRTAQSSWSIQPSVYLAVLAPLGNILLQYCLSQGLIYDWWNLASRTTTLVTLHNRWEHGTSVLSAGTPLKTFDKVSAAKILVTATFAVNPLLQRASRPYNHVAIANVTVPFRLATTKSSFRDVNFRSAYTDGFSDPIQLSPSMVTVMRDYTNRSPIINQLGNCPGNCTGTVKAAGIVANCSKTINETYRLDHEFYGGDPVVVFEAKTNVMNYHTHTEFNLSAFYIETKIRNDTTTSFSQYGPPGTMLPDAMQSCDGVSTQVVCELKHAVLDYPIVLRDNVISVDTRVSAVRTVQVEDNGQVSGDPERGELVFTGFSLAANSITHSAVDMSTAGRMGWNYDSTGPLPYFYMNKEQRDDLVSCEMAFTDPTDDILTTFNEIMFRISLAAFGNSSNSSQTTFYTMTALEPVIQYESRYIYLIAATCISLLACCSVLPIFNGFWRLDRPFSFSPIEIASAFDAPLFRPPGANTSDLPVEMLVKEVGNIEVQYSTVDNAHGTYMELRQRKFRVPVVV
ncbi:hypothetical protein D6D19_08628 [Aureobasidium pullulans]|uniref:Transmembrane protein n=1 Tax=Aureobasidium pullulans TaxID=5580 RepID=A0A4S8ZS34_AURPU|nr:hypothetical protein D6D19_08628 [Aureobasidium pullulans]